MAPGDANRDGKADLAVSAPEEDLGTRTHAVSALSENDGEGLVTVLAGTTQGVAGAGLFQVLRPQSLLIPTENLVRFGRSLVR